MSEHILEILSQENKVLLSRIRISFVMNSADILPNCQSDFSFPTCLGWLVSHESIESLSTPSDLFVSLSSASVTAIDFSVGA